MKSSAKAADRIAAVAAGDAPPLVPLDEAIDREHLARMTLGEQDLEREVLALFDRQASLLLSRMKAAEPAAAGALAHTLKGSAQGIGAWKVAEAAIAVERAASEPRAGEIADALAGLSAAVAETQAAIGELLRPR